MVEIKALYGKKVFVDANAFIYFFTGQCNNITAEIFRLSEEGSLTLITTTRVLDEVFFKVMIILAKIKFKIGSKIVQKLKKDKNKIKFLVEDVKKVVEFINHLKMEIKEISYSDLKKIPFIMETYGLFGNDALILAVMQKFNLKYLLSSDSDFDEIEHIKRIEVL